MFIYRSSVPFTELTHDWTLGKEFFLHIEADELDRPATTLPKNAIPGIWRSRYGKHADIAVSNKPGCLERFRASRVPQIFDPRNPEHIRAWHEYAVFRRAMPITFVLEHTYSTVPEMIMHKISICPLVEA